MTPTQEHMSKLHQQRNGLAAKRSAAVQSKNASAVKTADAELTALDSDIRVHEAIAEQERVEQAAQAAREARELRKRHKADAQTHFARKQEIAVKLQELADAFAKKWPELLAADAAGRAAAERAMGRAMEAPESNFIVMDALVNQLALAGVPIGRGLRDPSAPNIAATSSSASARAISELNRFTTDLNKSE